MLHYTVSRFCRTIRQVGKVYDQTRTTASSRVTGYSQNGSCFFFFFLFLTFGCVETFIRFLWCATINRVIILYYNNSIIILCNDHNISARTEHVLITIIIGYRNRSIIIFCFSIILHNKSTDAILTGKNYIDQAYLNGIRMYLYR